MYGLVVFCVAVLRTSRVYKLEQIAYSDIGYLKNNIEINDKDFLRDYRNFLKPNRGQLQKKKCNSKAFGENKTHDPSNLVRPPLPTEPRKAIESLYPRKKIPSR